MKYLRLLFFLLLILVISCKEKINYPTPSPDVSNDTNIKKWEKSIVNIECQSLSYTSEEINQIIENEKALNKINSVQDEIERRAALGRETSPVSGSAIYLTDKGKKYLVTARHVIYDPQESIGGPSWML